MLLATIGILSLWIAAIDPVHSAEQDEHRDFQYNSIVDSKTGRYNFAYDTGNDNDIAHSLHMQYRDANGIVRGRYGYTDPRGKLRMVEYEAGPDGFVARGDVGPDEFPHDQAPELTTSNGPLSANLQANDFNLVPRPVQMSGWDPMADPMGRPVTDPMGRPVTDPMGRPVTDPMGRPVTDPMGRQVTDPMGRPVTDPMGRPVTDPMGRPLTDYSSFAVGMGEDVGNTGLEYIDGYPSYVGYPEFQASNDTGDDNATIYAAPPEGYDDRYPRMYFSSSDVLGETESENLKKPDSEIQSELIQGVTSIPLTIDSNPLNINNIDVDPNDIRVSANSPVLQRSARDGTLATARSLPYSYRRYYPKQTHDHDAETRYRRYYPKQTHDHDAEMRYRRRQTHDHDAETRYSNRQTHDHDAEVRYYPTSRYTRERQYWVRPDHTHAAEDPLYHRRVHSHDRYYYPRRIFYKDSHSMVPHEHSSPVYRNDNDRNHQHSDIHLYRRSENYASYPATVKPRQLKYIPSDKYHDKYYYWADAA